jgi:hypothetical protein
MFACKRICVCVFVRETESVRERQSVSEKERERVSNGGEKETVDDANLKDLR